MDVYENVYEIFMPDDEASDEEFRAAWVGMFSSGADWLLDSQRLPWDNA